jgi:hypothetical protein
MLAEGRFTKPHEILAVLRPRLIAAGKDGKLMMSAAKLGMTYDQFDDEYQDERNALAYCSGMKDKSMGYLEWLRQRKYLDRKGQPVKAAP